MALLALALAPLLTFTCVSFAPSSRIVWCLLLHSTQLIVVRVHTRQDDPGATDVATLASKLSLEEICAGRSWQIQGASTLNANGLPQGLDWLAGALKKQPKVKKKPAAANSDS